MKAFIASLLFVPLLLTAQINSGYQSGLNQLLKIHRPGDFSISAPSVKGISRSSDTLVVGATGNDTLIIMGAWQHNGPIFIINNGVLIFSGAQATISGNVYVFNNGQLWADNSTLNFPQQYFYQRTLFTGQYGLVNMYSCALNFSGLSHNFSLTDSSTIILRKVHFDDWTTTGTYGQPTIIIDSCNLVGEIVITDSSRISISHCDTSLLWHQVARYAQLNWTFPADTNVSSYSLTPTSTGVSGIRYNVNVDQCEQVWWAIMPVDSSNVTISNSNLRAIGAWFTGNDTAYVTDLVNNATYPSVNDLFTDRYLQLTNTSVTTWSLYPMDSSIVYIYNCIAGEIGSMDHAQTVCNATFVDGSGGYFWATGNAAQYAVSCAFNSNVRSEGNAIVAVEYSSITNGEASGIAGSILALVQTPATQTPVANDGSDILVAEVLPPSTATVNDTLIIPGSAYILRGTSSLLMSFDHYNLRYQLDSTSTWYPITDNIFSPVNHNTLGTWNTRGLTPGNYTIMLTLIDNWGDSISAIAPIHLLPASSTGISEIKEQEIQLYPNPAYATITLDLPVGQYNSVTINDMSGRVVLAETIEGITSNIQLPVSKLPAGMYFVNIWSAEQSFTKKLLIAR